VKRRGRVPEKGKKREKKGTEIKDTRGKVLPEGEREHFLSKEELGRAKKKKTSVAVVKTPKSRWLGQARKPQKKAEGNFGGETVSFSCQGAHRLRSWMDSLHSTKKGQGGNVTSVGCIKKGSAG